MTTHSLDLLGEVLELQYLRDVLDHDEATHLTVEHQRLLFDLQEFLQSRDKVRINEGILGRMGAANKNFLQRTHPQVAFLL